MKRLGYALCTICLAACQGTGLTGANNNGGNDAGALDGASNDATTRDAGPHCGDGVLDPDEDCDGDNLGGFDCVSLGYDSGNLSCGSCSFDVSNCDEPVPVCGDGLVEGDEACDGANLIGLDCIDFGFLLGSLACSDTCDVDTDACHDPEPFCGDGILDPGEDCDGANLQGLDCGDLGFTTGTLSCSGTCDFDTDSCQDPTPFCGDGTCDWQSGTEDATSCSADCGCDPVTSAGCAANEGCVVDAASGTAQCEAAGTGMGQCGPTTLCQPGWFCDPTFVCLRYCAAASDCWFSPAASCYAFVPNVEINGNFVGYCY